MIANESIWHYYQPGYVHPSYVPYLRKKVIDRWGNEVSINTWEKQGGPAMVEPALVRVNKGLTFQRMFDTDPCPSGFTKAENSYCVRKPLVNEQVFFTDKAFIPKKQYWGGYADSEKVMNDTTPGDRSSSNFDMRTVHPFTGDYTIYYYSNKPVSPNRYGRPVMNTNKQYDQSWNLERHSGYAVLHTQDSYL